MKCEYCQNEPIRACLYCGVFYCKAHGRFKDALKFKGQPFQNSHCQRCAERIGNQIAQVGLVFVVIGAAMLVGGAILAIAAPQPAIGIIFLSQGIFFGILGAVFRFKHSKDNKPF